MGTRAKAVSAARFSPLRCAAVSASASNVRPGPIPRDPELSDHFAVLLAHAAEGPGPETWRRVRRDLSSR